jgi:acetate kinase
VDIVVLNAGSSSLKFSVFAGSADIPRATGLVDWAGSSGNATCHVSADGHDRVASIQAEDHLGATRAALVALTDLKLLDPAAEVAVGHRVVHGGAALRDAMPIDAEVRRQIDALSSIAPLHNPPALRAIDAARELLAGASHVAVFDTAFYRDLPRERYVYGTPYSWYEQWGIRRFGFHGISHAYCAARTAELLGRNAADISLITCHLGAGSSATATVGGAAVATSMGFTPMEGLMMGARSGSVDPGILLHVQRERGVDAGALDRALNRESGLLGVSGVSSDYRAVEAAAEAGHDRARLALDMYAEGVRNAVGALATTLDRLDALVFTAGIGENSAALRETVCDGLRILGLRIDNDLNAAARPDSEITAEGSGTRVFVVRTREDLMIARETRRIVEESGQ